MSTKIIHLGQPLLLTRASVLRLFPKLRGWANRKFLPYGKDPAALMAEVDGYIRELWRVNGERVPDTATAAGRNLRIGRGLLKLAAALLLLSLPGIIFAHVWVPTVLAPEDQAMEFVIGLARIAPLVLVAAFLLAGFLLVRHGERQLKPYDVSKALASSRSPLAGYLHRALAWIFLGRTRLRRLVMGYVLIILIMWLWAVGYSRVKTLVGIEAGLILGVPMLLFTFALIFWLTLLGGRQRVGRWLDWRGRQILQPSADELRRADRRNPVVFLRSFYDDTLEVEADEGGSRLEEVITLQLPRIGPLIAIGKPTEALPTLGAARNYYSDAEWKESIASWIDEAKVVVLFAGFSKGLEWEISTIASGGHGSKMLVLVPPINMQLRWNHLRAALLAVPGYQDLPERMPLGLVAVHGAADGNLTMLTTPGTKLADYERAIDYAIYGMFCHAPLGTPPDGHVPGA